MTTLPIDSKTPTDLRTVYGSLQLAAALAPGKEVLRLLGDRGYTAQDIIDRAARCASVLASLGAGHGERVAIMLTNRIEFVDSFFGIAQLGAISVPLNTSLRGPMLEHQMRETDPAVVVVETSMLEVMRPALGAIGSRARVLVVGAEHPLDAGYVHYAAAVADAPVAPVAPVDQRDVAAILYTSGTTGPSKGVVHNHNSLIAFSEKSSWLAEFNGSDVAFTCLPFFHANAIASTLLPMLRLGGTAVITERFSAGTYWEDVRAVGATAINLLGSMVPILWNAPASAADTANHVRVAVSVPTPTADIYNRFEERFGLRVVSLYGSTDATVVIGTPPGEHGRPGYCGKAHPDFDCRVVDDDDNPVAPGVPGELIIRPRVPDIMMQGYWANPAATVETWRNLWFHTGDILAMDSDGWFRFIDRKKDALRRFGENISSFEVESVVLMHTQVAEAAVYAVPSELSEDEVMVAVVPEDGVTVDASDLSRHCEKLLPYFAVPRYIDVRTALPKTANEKVRKDVLRAEGITAATVDTGPRGRRARERATSESARK
ncbi:AMP-binding protein [Nocardia sp. R6R-6]|uniref:AMP-binding protein n=1 Tax=Nocardia sp. R6R-6 TaxID=3459303 RepID=UPI00403E1D74